MLLTMKRSLAILLILFFIAPLSIKAEEIKNFSSQIKINQDGTINVTEKIEYDFGYLNRHGIYRIIPFIKINKDNKKYQLDYRRFTVEDTTGSPYRYTKTTENNNIKLKIGDPNSTITGAHTYIIKYNVAGALAYFSDHDELYWNITGDDWTIPILNTTSEVVLPVNISQSDIKFICYTGYFGSMTSDCTSSFQNARVNFQSDKPFQAGEGMTISISFPKNIVSVLEPKPYVPFWETLLGKIISVFIGIGILILALFWYLVYPIWLPIKWYLNGRDPTTNSGPVQAWYDPPRLKADRPLDVKTNRFLTPVETGTLIDERVQMRDISGTIINLAQRGYFKIVEKKKGDFYFVSPESHRKWDEGGQPKDHLLPFEKKLISSFFKEGNELRLKEAKLYDTLEEIKKMIYADLVMNRFFPKDPNKIRIYYNAIAGIALFTFNLPLALFSFLFGSNMPKKTVIGVQATNVAQSLKNFLTSQQRQLEFQAKNQVFFEKLLPYAVVFGVERVWAERFKDIHMNPPDWYQGHNASTFNSIYFANAMNSSMSSFQSAATPTTSSSGFSSGFSGGSSGGGGGGGGGGSW